MTLEFDERQMDESIEILVDIVVKDKMDNLHGKCPYSDPDSSLYLKRKPCYMAVHSGR